MPRRHRAACRSSVESCDLPAAPAQQYREIVELFEGGEDLLEVVLGNDLNAPFPHCRPFALVGQDLCEAGGQSACVAGLEEMSVHAFADQVWQGFRVGSDDRLARSHRLHRGDAEDVRGSVGTRQVLIFYKAGKDDVTLYAFPLGKLDQLRPLMPVANDHQLRVDLLPHDGQGPYEVADALLRIQPAHVHAGRLLRHAVLVPEAIPVVAHVEAGEVYPARERDDLAIYALLLDEPGGEGSRSRDQVGLVEHSGEVAPEVVHYRLLCAFSQAQVVDQVVRHEVVGGDNGDAQLLGGPDPGPPDEVVALDVDDVRLDALHLAQDATEKERRRGEPKAAIVWYGHRRQPVLDHPGATHHLS